MRPAWNRADDLLALLGRQHVARGRKQLDAVVFGRIVAGRDLDGARGRSIHAPSTPTVGVAATSASSTERPAANSAPRIASTSMRPGAATVACQDQRAGRLPGRIGTREAGGHFRRQVFANDAPQTRTR